MSCRDVPIKLDENSSFSKAISRVLELTDEEFEKSTQKDIDELEDKRLAQQNTLDNKITSLIASIQKNQDIISDEIDMYFTEKKSKLTKSLSDWKRLRSVRDDINNAEVSKTMSIAIGQMEEYVGNLMRERGYFCASNFVGTADIGKFCIDSLMKDRKINLESIPTKIIPTKIGYIILEEYCKIIELESKKPIISTEDEILDICPTFDGNLDYIALTQREKCYYHKLDLPSLKSKCFPLNLYNINDAKLLVKGSKLFVADISSNIIYYFVNTKEYQDSFLWEKKSKIKTSDKIMGLHLLNNTIIIIHESKITLMNCNSGDQQISIDIESYTGSNPSINELIMKDLNDYCILDSFNHHFIWVDCQNKKAFSIKAFILFGDRKFISYDLKDDELVIFLIERTDKKKMTIEYYKRKHV